jgi:hypothetical protein
MMTHISEEEKEIFHCEFCNTPFTRQDSLKDHIRKFHEKKETPTKKTATKTTAPLKKTAAPLKIDILSIYPAQVVYPQTSYKEMPTALSFDSSTAED